MNINDLFEMGPIGSKLELSATVLAFPPFQRVLLDREDREAAINEIRFILWYKHWRSPYSVVSDDRRESQVKQDIFGDPEYVISEVAKVAMSEYINVYQTTDRIMALEAAQRGSRWINSQIDAAVSGTVDIDPVKVSQLIQQNTGRAKALDDAIESAKKESAGVMNVRGGSAVGNYELPTTDNFTRNTTSTNTDK